MVPTMRTCTKCNVEFPATTEYFGFQKHGKFGLRSQCNPCRTIESVEYVRKNKIKVNNRRKKWRINNPEKTKAQAKKTQLKQIGFTLELQQLMLEAQGNMCALCGTDTPAGRHNVWNSDHDHKTGKARGMLCNSCNTTLGHIEAKSPDWMDKARRYIDQGGFHTVTSQETVIQP
jgi:hypothetical protein